MLDFIYQHLPPITVALIFAERMREVFAKRNVVAGKTQETLTFNLFMLCGMLIVAGQVANEGTEVAPGLVLEQIRPRSAVLRFRGFRYSVPY